MRRFLDMWAFLLFLCTPTLCSAVILGARLFSKQVSDPLERLAGAAFLTSVAAGPHVGVSSPTSGRSTRRSIELDTAIPRSGAG
jgi:hypothetical protein